MSGCPFISPGFCCEPGRGAFDIYGLIPTPNNECSLPHAGGLTRYGVMWPDRVASGLNDNDMNVCGYHSQHRTGWVIPPAAPLTQLATHLSYGTLVHPDTERVWSCETRDGQQRVVLYDAQSQSEVVSIADPHLASVVRNTTILTTTNNTFSAASAEEFFYWVTASPSVRSLYKSDGTIEALTFPTQTNSVDRSSIDVFPPHDWPIASGRRYVTNDQTGVTTISFGYGPVSISSGVVNWQPSTIVHSYQTLLPYSLTTSFPWDGFRPSSQQLGTASNSRWRAFDSCQSGTTHCGVIAYYKEDAMGVAGSPIRAYVHVIANGNIVKTFSSQLTPALYGVDTIGGYADKCVPGIAPGDGFCANHTGEVFLSLYDFAQEPNHTQTGSYVDPQRPEIGIVRSSVELWRSQRVGSVFCQHASDSWFYLRGNRTISAAPVGLPPSGWLPNESRTVFPTSTPVDTWLVAPDGSQACPIGELDYGTNLITPPRTVMPRGIASPITGLTFYDCVKNTALIPHSLPADASEFESAVQSVTS